MAGKRTTQTRDKIKDVAQQLIAEHGVDGMSIRDIITAAGQRNMASLYYYFRNKEELIKELIVDAAEIMEGTRADHLSRMEEIGEPLTVRQIVHIILSGAKLDPSEGGRNATIMRFIGAVRQSHRHLFVEAIGDKYNKTFQRCLDLLRNQLQHIPLPILNQRLLFLDSCGTNLLIAREEAMASPGHAREYWEQPRTYLNMLDFLCGGLQAPVTESELGLSDDVNAGRIRHFMTNTPDVEDEEPARLTAPRSA
jgi:AcrR family transcriptional regulator